MDSQYASKENSFWASQKIREHLLHLQQKLYLTRPIKKQNNFSLHMPLACTCFVFGGNECAQLLLLPLDSEKEFETNFWILARFKQA
jgi:hypothetical protein